MTCDCGQPATGLCILEDGIHHYCESCRPAWLRRLRALGKSK